MFCAFSSQENFGGAVLEASTLGIQVITSNIGFPEVVINGLTGIIIEKLNFEYARKVILKLVRDKESRKNLGKNGMKFVNKKYNWNDSINRIEQLYKSLLFR
ncbi:glycosyltransferase [Prochlorococcus sp. AH-716-E17]|nr:glycosyltransferase [Prochlorococcus sp. AH-716-E17]